MNTALAFSCIAERSNLKPTAQQATCQKFRMRFSLTTAIWNGKTSTLQGIAACSRCITPSPILKTVRSIGWNLEIVLHKCGYATFSGNGCSMADFPSSPTPKVNIAISAGFRQIREQELITVALESVVMVTMAVPC